MARSAFSFTLLSPGPAVSPLSTRTLLHYNPPGGGRRREMSERCKFEAGKRKRKRFRSFFPPCLLHSREEHRTRNGKRQWARRREMRACALWIGLSQMSARKLRKSQLFMTSAGISGPLYFIKKEIFIKLREPFSKPCSNSILITDLHRIHTEVDHLQSEAIR